jgi:hypothetical protein
MSDTIELAAPDPRALALRDELIGDRVTIEQAAAAFNVTERAIYGVIARHNIPYIKVFNSRYLAPADLRRALVKDIASPPRGRGRPSKSAA